MEIFLVSPFIFFFLFSLTFPGTSVIWILDFHYLSIFHVLLLCFLGDFLKFIFDSSMEFLKSISRCSFLSLNISVTHSIHVCRMPYLLCVYTCTHACVVVSVFLLASDFFLLSALQSKLILHSGPLR